MAGPIAEAAVELVADGRRFGASARDEIRRGIAGADKDVSKGLNRGMAKAGRDGGTDWSSAFRIAVAQNVASFGLEKMLAPLQGIGKSIGFSVIAAGAASAAASVVSFGAALAPTVGILAALPATVAVAGAALGTLRLALSGVGDAFSAALSEDAEAFSDSLEGLSPAAQTVARDLRSLRPAFDDLQSSVQESFFEPLTGQIQKVGRALMGPLKDGMSAVAEEAGVAARGIAEFARESETVDVLSAVFDTTRQAIANIGPALRTVFGGIRDVIGAALPSVESLSERVADLATQFGEWLSSAAEYGRVDAWISAAADTFRQLGTILQQTLGIFHALGKAANEAGGGILEVMGEALRSVNAFFSSAEGQETLVTIFSALADVGAQLAPIFRAAAGALATVAPEVADIATAIGPGIAAAISAVGPALAALGPGLTAVAEAMSEAFSSPAVAKGLSDLGSAFAGLLAAVAPLIPLVADAAGALGSHLATSINTAVSLLSPLIDAFVWVGDAISAAAGPIGIFGDGIGTLVGIVAAIITAVKVWTAVQWALNTALRANPIGLIITAVGALVAAFAWAWNEFAGFRQFWIDLWNGIVETVQPVIDLITDAWQAFVDWWGEVWAEIQAPVTAAWEFIQGTIVVAMTAIWETIQAVWNSIVAVFTAVWETIKGVIQGAVDVVRGIIDIFLGGLSGNWSQVWNGLVSVLSGVWNMITSIVSGAVSMLKGIISGALSTISGIFSSVWNGIKGGVSAAWDGIVSGVSDGIDSMMNFIGDIPDKVIGFFADAGSWLIEAGKKIIGGLIDGIKSMISAVGDAIGSIVDTVSSYLPFSPAKQGPLSGRGAPIYSGRSIGRQLADGIAEQRGRVHAEMRRVVRPPSGALRAPRIASATRYHAAGFSAATSGSQIDRSSHRQVSINAPITVHTRASDPEIVARKTADRLAALAQG